MATPLGGVCRLCKVWSADVFSQRRLALGGEASSVNRSMVAQSLLASSQAHNFRMKLSPEGPCYAGLYARLSK